MNKYNSIKPLNAYDKNLLLIDYLYKQKFPNKLYTKKIATNIRIKKDNWRK